MDRGPDVIDERNFKFVLYFVIPRNTLEIIAIMKRVITFCGEEEGQLISDRRALIFFIAVVASWRRRRLNSRAQKKNTAAGRHPFRDPANYLLILCVHGAIEVWSGTELGRHLIGTSAARAPMEDPVPD